MKVAYSKEKTKWKIAEGSITGGTVIEDTEGNCICEILYATPDNTKLILNSNKGIELLGKCRDYIDELMFLAKANLPEAEHIERSNKLIDGMTDIVRKTDAFLDNLNEK